jgi:hypothetical protein
MSLITQSSQHWTIVGIANNSFPEMMKIEPIRFQKNQHDPSFQ